jgi:hypothetical protein
VGTPGRKSCGLRTTGARRPKRCSHPLCRLAPHRRSRFVRCRPCRPRARRSALRRDRRCCAPRGAPTRRRRRPARSGATARRWSSSPPHRAPPPSCSTAGEENVSGRSDGRSLGQACEPPAPTMFHDSVTPLSHAVKPSPTRLADPVPASDTPRVCTGGWAWRNCTRLRGYPFPPPPPAHGHHVRSVRVHAPPDGCAWPGKK